MQIEHHQEQLIKVNDDLHLNFDSFGDQSHPPMILIMGLGTQMIFWHDAFCKQLAAKGFWVIRFDNRDIGKSSWLNHSKLPGRLATLSNILFNSKITVPYLLEDMADDTLGLMKALNIDAAHLVGASMGGMIAQCLALKFPSKVLSLTSIMSTTGNRALPKASSSVSLKLVAPVPKEPTAYLKHAVSIWKLIHGPHYPFDEINVEELLQLALQRGLNPKGVKRQFLAILASPDRTTALAKLQIPTLVVHGELDPLVPLACGIATADAIANAKLKVFTGMGHTLPKALWDEMISDIASLALNAELTKVA
jgi:pimeloyl-ACP methyl ester carboxylesterase